MVSRRMKTSAVTILFAVVLVAGCGRYFAPDINLKRYATEKEIVGRWNLATQTLQIANRGGYAPAPGTQHEITFREDGTCDFRSITEFGQKAEYRNAHGSWKLEHDAGMQSEKKRRNQVSIRINDLGIRLYLTEENGRLLLWNFWGDPDSWEFIKYDRTG
jgi:hypothetical protein